MASEYIGRDLVLTEFEWSKPERFEYQTLVSEVVATACRLTALFTWTRSGGSLLAPCPDAARWRDAAESIEDRLRFEGHLTELDQLYGTAAG